MSISLHKRIQILEAIGDYILSEDVSWEQSIVKAGVKNPWFTPEMIRYAAKGIAHNFLSREILEKVSVQYAMEDSISSKVLGIVNAGNIPLVGFHDFLSAFLTGIPSQIKLSAKDDVLFKDIYRFSVESFPETAGLVQIVDKLENCDGYIATGGESTALYFKKYFGTKPNIIRGHRTSVAILDGNESTSQLEALSDDIHLFFGLGCRSVTHIFVPEQYDFQDLLESFHKYEYFSEHNKYMNNYDYQLAIFIINGDKYMQRYSTLLVEDKRYSSPVSAVYFSLYSDRDEAYNALNLNEIQCVVSSKDIPFGQSQSPDILDFADGIDTFDFCKTLR